MLERGDTHTFLDCVIFTRCLYNFSSLFICNITFRKAISSNCNSKQRQSNRRWRELRSINYWAAVWWWCLCVCVGVFLRMPLHNKTEIRHSLRVCVCLPTIEGTTAVISCMSEWRYDAGPPRGSVSKFMMLVTKLRCRGVKNEQERTFWD